MPEFRAPQKPPQRSFLDRVETVLDWFVDDTGEHNWVLPPSVLQGGAEEVKSVATGEITDEAGAEKFGVKSAAKKVAGGPVLKAPIDLLFGGQQAGGPDRDTRPRYVKQNEDGTIVIHVIGANGQEEPVATIPQDEETRARIRAAGQQLKIGMLPMWDADP